MRYLKYVCKNCTLNGKKILVWYKLNDKGYRPGQKLIPYAECGRCGEEMACRAVQKSQPRGGRDLGGALSSRVSKTRVMRSTALKSSTALAILMAEESKDEKKGDDDKDLAYAPPAAFNPAMRLTTGSLRRTCSPTFTVNDSYMKTSTRVRIAPSNMRMSGGDTSTVMGTAINGGTRLSAAAHANRPAYTTNKFASSEWCHLQGDCLGGYIMERNLVSASFAANTEMLAIEHAIMGRTEFEIEVVARCSAPHVARMIIYTVYAKNGSWTRTIDACNDYFTKEDLEEVQASIRDFVTTHKQRR